jgi:hypothetical protein
MKTLPCSKATSGSMTAASPPITPRQAPRSEEVVEELFQKKLVKAVFATETPASASTCPP